MITDEPLIKPSANIAELSVRSIILAILLTILLAISNAYLALKLGFLTSASIPAAIISMGCLRWFKNPTILENNAVQTAASAGEAVAGGVVYTLPALIIIGYWHQFDYFTNFLIAICGGGLGVLLSVPLRRILVHDPLLRFPEGRAIAEVLKFSGKNLATTDNMKNIFIGSCIGGIFELLQTGFKLIASNWNMWFVVKRTLLGIGIGFSATMIGAGYLIGAEMAVSIFFGTIIAWLLAVPIASHVYPVLSQHASAEIIGVSLWNSHVRYLGIGAMLFSGSLVFIKLLKPLLKNIHTSFRIFTASKRSQMEVLRTERDMPVSIISLGTLGLLVAIFFGFQFVLPVHTLGLGQYASSMFILSLVIYILIIGILFAVICAYFSGMIGVSASPGSSVMIAGIILTSWMLSLLISYWLPGVLSSHQVHAAEAITIMVGSMLTSIAAIANDNAQDLKVGQLIGATPWKQQLMLLVGVVIASLVIPPVMQLLFNVYGVAGIMPHSGMQADLSLPAPTAALMAAITQAVFKHAMPWHMLFIGAGIIAMIALIIKIFKVDRYLHISILGVAIGMYLPMSSSTPILIGGLIAMFIHQRLDKRHATAEVRTRRVRCGVLVACGLVTGSALIDVLLTIPFSIWHSPDALCLVGPGWQPYSILIAIFSIGCFIWWLNDKSTQ